MKNKEKPVVRIDKFLWAVRICKTRSQAADACRNGHISMGGSPVKASREIKAGDIIVFKQASLTRTIEVKEILSNRVSARLVPEYILDLTPPEEYQKDENIRKTRVMFRPRGSGRPTKKERRDIDRWSHPED